MAVGGDPRREVLGLVGLSGIDVMGDGEDTGEVGEGLGDRGGAGGGETDPGGPADPAGGG